jgi:hypothetical protein
MQSRTDPYQGIAFRRADELGQFDYARSARFLPPRALGLKPVSVGFSFGAAEKPRPATSLISNYANV